jgi:hypothetical protein
MSIILLFITLLTYDHNALTAWRMRCCFRFRMLVHPTELCMVFAVHTSRYARLMDMLLPERLRTALKQRIPVEDKKSLKSATVFCKFADAIQHKVDKFFPNGVMSSGVVVCGVLFPTDHLFGMKQTTVSSRSHFVCSSKYEEIV